MTFTNLNIVWGVFLSVFPYFILAFIPVWDQLRYSKKTAVLAAGLCMFLNIASIIVIIHTFPNWNSFRFFHSIFFLILYVVIFIVMVRGTPAKLVFLAFLVKTYADFIVNMAKLLEVNYISHIEHRIYVQSSYSFYFNLFQCLILLLTYPLVWAFLRKKVTHVMKTHNKAWGFLWIIPLVYYIISLSFTAMNYTLIAQWQFLVFNLVSFFGFLLIYYVVIEMLEQSEKNILLSESNRAIRQQLLVQADYYRKFSECIEETKKAEHDLRHHLRTLQGMIHQSNGENADDYIKELLGNQLNLSDMMYCSNDAVNAILGYYANVCKQEGIDLRIATEAAGDLSVDESDLCVVFGNLLENAVEACRRMADTNRVIEVSSHQVGNQLFITVDNSYAGEIKIKKGVYLSQKRTEEPGIGILSVTAVAKKYMGQASFEADDQRFRVSIMMRG